MNATNLLTVPEFLARNEGRIARNTLYMRVRQGTFPHVRLGRKVLIPADAFDRLVQGGLPAAATHDELMAEYEDAVENDPDDQFEMLCEALDRLRTALEGHDPEIDLLDELSRVEHHVERLWAINRPVVDPSTTAV